MSVSLSLLLVAGVFITGGVYLLLERTLTRIILGFVLAGNGINLLFIVAAGDPGKPPFEGTANPADMSDPLPFAMVLTAIVITMGMSAFGMALAYRAWQLFGHDEVPDDIEDRRVFHRALSRRSAHAGEDRNAMASWRRARRTRVGPALSEDHRLSALMASQGQDIFEDPMGSDLSGVEDSPVDYTEADEEQVVTPPRKSSSTSSARRDGGSTASRDGGSTTTSVSHETEEEGA